jgi:hypothetical protein
MYSGTRSRVRLLTRPVSTTKLPPQSAHVAKPESKVAVGVFGGRPDKRPPAIRAASVSVYFG